MKTALPVIKKETTYHHFTIKSEEAMRELINYPS